MRRRSPSTAGVDRSEATAGVDRSEATPALDRSEATPALDRSEVTPALEREASALAALGLVVGEAVRFRRPARSRWQPGVVQRLERDGSIGISDSNGSSRAVALTHVQVRVRPRRPGLPAPDRWEPLAARVDRTEQLSLL